MEKDRLQLLKRRPGGANYSKDARSPATHRRGAAFIVKFGRP